MRTDESTSSSHGIVLLSSRLLEGFLLLASLVKAGILEFLLLPTSLLEGLSGFVEGLFGFIEGLLRLVEGLLGLVEGLASLFGEARFLADANLLAIHAFSSLGDPHLENPIAEVGLDVIDLHVLGEPEGAAEMAEAALAEVILVGILLLLLLALAADRQKIVIQLDVDVFLLHARQLAIQEQFLVALANVEEGSPAGDLLRRSRRCRLDFSLPALI